MMRLIKSWCFEPAYRWQLTYSDTTKIRLSNDNPVAPGLELALVNGAYPVDLDVSAKTWVTTPRRVKRWLGFQEEALTPTGTATLYRLDFGAGDRWWDGGAWVAPSTDSHWNTAQEVNDNLAAATWTGVPSLAVRACLRSDGVATPRVTAVKVLVEADLEWNDDLIYDTIIRSLQAYLRPATVIEIAASSTGTTFDLSSTYKLDNPYNFTGIKAAYNLTTDPDARTDIATGYAPGAAREDGTNEPGVVSVTSPVTAGDVVRLEMLFVPEIAVQTHQDYYEVERLPAVVFERINVVTTDDHLDVRAPYDGAGENVKDFGAGTAVVLPWPELRSVKFDYCVLAKLSTDLNGIVDAVERWKANNRVLRTWGMDEAISIQSEESYDSFKRENMDDVHTAEGSFRARSIPFYLRSAVDAVLVNNVVIGVEQQ